jgi:hypothetical protein
MSKQKIKTKTKSTKLFGYWLHVTIFDAHTHTHTHSHIPYLKGSGHNGSQRLEDHPVGGPYRNQRRNVCLVGTNCGDAVSRQVLISHTHTRVTVTFPMSAIASLF